MEILLIKDGIVEIVLNANGVEDVIDYYPEYLCMERTDSAWVGWKYENGLFIAPPGVTSDSSKCITQYAFISRFTDEEAIGIDLASQGATMQAATLRRMQKKIDAAEFVNLASPEVVGGVALLETFGFLAPGRASEITDSPVQAHEFYSR